MSLIFLSAIAIHSFSVDVISDILKKSKVMWQMFGY